MGTINGGAGNDLLTGTSGVDTVDAYGGDDTVDAGAGDDLVFGGDGNDHIYGGADNDTLGGDNGDDTLSGGTGDNHVYGGAGNDVFIGGAGRDAYYGGAGQDNVDYSGSGSGVFVNLATNAVSGGDAADDTLASGIDGAIGSNYADVLTGGDGQGMTAGDTYTTQLYGNAGNDLLSGGAGNDQIYGGADDDTLYGGRDDDALYGDAGNDSLWGGAGNDALYGGTGNDALYGDTGNDLLFGGGGDDTLAGGAGDDTLYTGSGNDLVILNLHGGQDTVDDFDTGDSDLDGQTNDQFDVSDLVNAGGNPVRVFDVSITGDGNGNSVLHFPGGEVVTVIGLSPADAASPGMLHAMGIPCFAAGTRILTPQGERAVEQLAVGDMVLTPQGAQPVLWHGARHLDAGALRDQPELRPIRVKAGRFGLQRDLTVSPQHAVLVPGVGLVRARHLAEWGQGARVAQGVRSVTYHHLLLPHHALIWAEGGQAESFYPGRMALAALGLVDRLDVARIILRFGARSGSLCEVYGPRCQPVLTQREAKAGLRQGKAYVAA